MIPHIVLRVRLRHPVAIPKSYDVPSVRNVKKLQIYKRKYTHTDAPTRMHASERFHITVTYRVCSQQPMIATSELYTFSRIHMGKANSPLVFLFFIKEFVYRYDVKITALYLAFLNSNSFNFLTNSFILVTAVSDGL